MEELLQHFSHEHALALCDDGDGDGVRKCFGCSQSVVRGSLTYYTCAQCEFFLHKSCATELPEKIMSFLHSRHPLTLIVITNERWDCDGCHVTHDDSGFAYNCSLCEFNLDIKCASLNNNVVIHESQGGRHEHSFILLRPLPVICDVCGYKPGNQKSYLCTTCQFQSCKDCFPFPLTVKQIGHHHRLSFSTSYTEDPLVANSINYLCKICYNRVNKRVCFYYCADCNYIAHVQCATAVEDIIVDDDDENQELLLLQPQHTLHSSDDHLEHFSHQHCLTLMNNDDEATATSEEESNSEDGDDDNKIICDGCVQQISSSSSTPFYYGCAKCNFYLHTSCAQLPNKILHPLHEHALFLFAEASKRVASIFKCNACGTLCNGFVYMCERCNFFIDVKCSSFSADPFEHKGHHCRRHDVEVDDDDYEDGDEQEEVLPLIVHPVKQGYGRPKKLCNACDLLLPSLYRCETCTSFKLDMRCAALPYTIKHKCPKDNTRDLLELTFESIDDVTGEYYCDACEERRGKDDWFYYCNDCDYAVHPDCALGKYRIKFGKSYELNAHPHPLTLTVIEKRKGKPPSCWSCTGPCEELVLMCAECNFYVHHKETCSESLGVKIREMVPIKKKEKIREIVSEEEVLPVRKFRKFKSKPGLSKKL